MLNMGLTGRLLGIGLPSLKSIYKAARQIILWVMGGLILRPSNFLTNETRNLSNWVWLKLSIRCNESQSLCILCAFCLMLMWCNQLSRRGQIYLHYTGLKLLSFALGCCNASLSKSVAATKLDWYKGKTTFRSRLSSAALVTLKIVFSQLSVHQIHLYYKSVNFILWLKVTDVITQRVLCVSSPSYILHLWNFSYICSPFVMLTFSL